jgi:phosphoadenosine phosphosulfate reductase
MRGVAPAVPPQEPRFSFSIEEENDRLERATPEDRLAFAVATFGEGLLFTSSFGAGSGVLLHLWSRVAPRLPVYFLDTGFLFDETLVYRDALAELLGLRVITLRPALPREEFLAAHGADIMARDADFCCARNKVDPLEPLRQKATAWVSGLRRDQSATRATTPILLPEGDGPLKVHPLATMTRSEAEAYLLHHGIPEHPLRARRYLSIGCAPCTRPVEEGDDERAGRWAGQEKTECGLHSPRRPAKTPRSEGP